TLIANSYAPTTMLRDNTYYWRVRSLDAFGNAGEWNLGPSFTKTFDKVPPVSAPSVKNVHLRDNLSDPGSDVDGGRPGYQTYVPVVTWDPVPGASSYEVDVFPFEGGMCNWSSGALDHWHSQTATNAWTMLGYSWNNVKPYADARPVASEAFHPDLNDEYCVRVRARADRAGEVGAAGPRAAASPPTSAPGTTSCRRRVSRRRGCRTSPGSRWRASSPTSSSW